MSKEIAPTHQEGRANVPARGNRYTPEQRKAIVDAALARIVDGDGLREIAADHGITYQTLHAWLSALGDEYTELRQRWLDSMLTAAKLAIDGAPDHFELARGREQWRYATWYAERRDPARYGAKPQGDGAVNIQVIVER